MPQTTPQSGPVPSSANDADDARVEARPSLLFRAPRAGLVRRLLVALFLLCALTVVAANVFQPGRPQRLRLLHATEARLESMTLTLEQQNDRLLGELERLERGAEGWQALARKEYGMLLDGELVYRFPPARHE